MDSSALNKTTTFLNSLSGNYFPMRLNDDHHSMGQKIYMAFTWTMTIIYFSTTLVSLILMPTGVSHEIGVAGLAAVIEVIVLAICLNLRLSLFRKLTNETQKILIDNDTLKEAISQILDPINRLMKIYVMCGVLGPTIWHALNFVKLFKQDQFSYMDFNLPAYFPFGPFGQKLFTFYVTVQIIGSVYIGTKKFATDLCVVYIVALLTAQYKYLANDLTNILNNNESRLKSSEDLNVTGSEINCNDRLKTWIKHHQAVIAISRMVKDLTSLNVLVTSASCTFSFGFWGYTLIKVSLEFWKQCVVIAYGMGCSLQLYTLCYCAQELSDSSESVTTKAFNAEWSMHSQSTKKTFLMIIMADEIRTRLSAFGIINLSLETFTQIIHHAYTACLLFQKAERKL